MYDIVVMGISVDNAGVIARMIMNIDVLFIKDQSSSLRIAKAHEPNICALKGF